MTKGASSAPADLNERLRELEESAAEKDRLIQADCLKIRELQDRVILLQQEKAALLCDINDVRAQLGYPVLEAVGNER